MPAFVEVVQLVHQETLIVTLGIAKAFRYVLTFDLGTLGLVIQPNTFDNCEGSCIT